VLWGNKHSYPPWLFEGYISNRYNFINMIFLNDSLYLNIFYFQKWQPTNNLYLRRLLLKIAFYFSYKKRTMMAILEFLTNSKYYNI